MRTAFLLSTLVAVLPTLGVSQTLEQRIAKLGSGTVHLSFAARSGVCQDGGGGGHFVGQQRSTEWEPDCRRQLVRVALRIRDGLPVAVRTYIGGRWRPAFEAHDLGIVPAGAAASYLLRLAGERRAISGDPVFPAALADSVVIWPSLLALGRAGHVPHERRRTAIFWLGQTAGDSIVSALDSIALDDSGSREIRKHAVFALSQRSPDEAVPVLIRIARSHPDPELRRTAVFWLGQTADPRALDLFQDILR